MPRSASYALVAVWLWTACGQSALDPSQTYRTYLSSLAKPDMSAAWALLSAPSRQAFEEAAKKSQAGEKDPLLRAAAAPPGTRFESGLALFGACMSTGYPSHVPYLTPSTVDRVKVEVDRTDESNTSLKVLTPVGTESVRLVRESAGWRIALDL